MPRLYTSWRPSRAVRPPTDDDPRRFERDDDGFLVLVVPPDPERPEPAWKLRRATPPAAPFPVAALGPELAAAARAIEARTLAPLALCGQAVLGAAALAAQAHADVRLPDGRQSPLSLALLSVASPGQRLGAVEDFALRAVRAQERRLHEDYASQRAAYDTDRAAWRGARRGGTDRGRAAIGADPDAAGPCPEAPRTPCLVAGDPTPDGLLRLLAEGQASMGLFNADGPAVIGGRSRAARRRMSGLLSRLFDAGSAERAGARGGAVKLYGKRLSLHLAAEAGAGPAGLAARDMSGLSGRLLCVMPASTVGRRFLSDDGEARIAATQGDLDRFESRIAALLRAAPRAIELAPRPLPLAPDAARMWRDFSNQIETALDGGGDPDSVAALAGAAPGQVARIAGVLSIYADTQARDIPAEAIAGAIDLMRHYLDEARRIAGMDGADAELRRAQAVLDHITGLGRPVVHLAEIYQRGPYAVRDAAAAGQAMRLLEDHGHVEAIRGGAEVDGLHRFEAWRVVAPPAAEPARPAKAAKVAAPSASATALRPDKAARSADPATAPKAAPAAEPAQAAKVAVTSAAAMPAATPAEAAKPAQVAAPPASAAPAEAAKPAQVAAPPASAAAVLVAEPTAPAAPPAAPAAERDSCRPERGEGPCGGRPGSGDAGQSTALDPLTTAIAQGPAPGARDAATATAQGPAPGARETATATAQGPAPGARETATATAQGPAPRAPEAASSAIALAAAAGGAAEPDLHAAHLAARGVPLEWTLGVAGLDPAVPGPDFTPRQWSAFVEVCGRLLADHGRALQRMGWTAPQLFGFHPRAPWRRLDIAGLALFLVATQGATITEIRDDGVVYETAAGPRRPYWRTRPRFSGVAAWLLAPQDRDPAGGAGAPCMPPSGGPRD